MKKLLLPILLAACLHAATNNVTATSLWRVWTTGSLNNGGCFDPANIGATGVDYSKQTAAQYTLTTALTTSGAGSTTLTDSGGSPFDNTMLGNCIHITAGTGFTAGYYVITGFTDVNDIVLNISPTPAGAGSGGTGIVGGATTTIAQAETGVVGGNTVYIKATATYTITSGLNFATSGSSGAPISWIGYTTTDTDGGPAVIQASGSSINMIGGSGSFQRFLNLTIDCNSQTSSRGSSFTGSNSFFGVLTVKNCTTAGLLISGNSEVVKNSYFTNNGSVGGASISSIGNLFRGNLFAGNSGPGVNDSSSTASGMNVYLDNVFANNTGALVDGLLKSGASGLFAWGNVFYTNGRDGIRITGASSADDISLGNNIIYGNVGVGLDIVTTNWSTHSYWTDINFNGVGGNGTDRTNAAVGGNDVTLTADPFTNGSGNVFTLNSTAGGGAALKTAGYPATLPLTVGSGFPDIGPLQSACSGGAAVTHTCSGQ